MLVIIEYVTFSYQNTLNMVAMVVREEVRGQTRYATYMALHRISMANLEILEYVTSSVYTHFMY